MQISVSRAFGAIAACALPVGTLAADGSAASPAQAADGGEHLETNPGIVSLTDASGNQLCSAVLVAPQWALTWEGPSTCMAATHATGDSHDAVAIDRQEFRSPAGDAPGNYPTESQAMLVHFSSPVQRVQPAELSKDAPKPGEKLQIAAFNGPEGINHPLSVGRSDVTVKGHNAWISWYDHPAGMRLDRGLDTGDPFLRDGKVVAFTGLVSEHSVDAEDVANVYDWVQQTVSAT